MVYHSGDDVDSTSQAVILSTEEERERGRVCVESNAQSTEEAEESMRLQVLSAGGEIEFGVEDELG